MLTLYYKPTCPYSKNVLAEAETLGIQLNLKDISTDDAIAQELTDKGGKRQVPYLVDDERDTSMYESSEITKYLQRNYAYPTSEKKESSDGLRIYKSDDTCETSR